MMKSLLIITTVGAFFVVLFLNAKSEDTDNEAHRGKTAQVFKFEPNWPSLDARPLPKWYDDAKIGIFLHWGVYSVPGFGSEWFWEQWKGRNQTAFIDFMNKTYPKDFTYQEFARDFTAEFFDPDEWARLFKISGAKYVVLTSKHHEGFALWPSKYSFSWNAKDLGPHRDLVGDLSKSVRKEGLRFGLYHSLYEWFNPLYLSDKRSNFTKKEFVRNKVLPQLHEIIEQYRPEVLWSDGEWEAQDTYWESKEFLAWLYNDSPVKETVVTNDRWGMETLGKHGDFYTCKDRFNPGTLIKHKWENAMTLDIESWGFRRNARISEYLTTYQLIKTLVETISCGGNILINVGPTKDGMIAPIFQERLVELGNWLSVNEEAVYESKPWIAQNDTQGDVWYTSKAKNVYAFTLNWPDKNTVKLGSAASLFKSDKTAVTLLGNSEKLKWNIVSNVVNVILPDKATVACDWVWVLKITS